VSTGLSDIIDKCLAPEPAQRYRSAAALAADLRRQLADLPLEGVRNRDWRERWRKWRRRRPHGLALWGLLAAVLAAAGGAAALLLLHFRDQRNAARIALVEGQRQFQQRQYQEALATFRRARILVENLPGSRDLARELSDQIRRALLWASRPGSYVLSDGSCAKSGVFPDPSRGGVAS
jgi:serine/threonine-protein kinase